jgi:hypothetical protein
MYNIYNEYITIKAQWRFKFSDPVSRQAAYAESKEVALGTEISFSTVNRSRMM